MSSEQELKQKYGELSAIMHELTKHDPRSHHMASTRLEESLFWALKGMNTPAAKDETNGNNER